MGIEMWEDVPPALMPLTSVSETVRSAALSVSFAVSVADLRSGEMVEKGRALVTRRAERIMVDILRIGSSDEVCVIASVFLLI